MEKRIYDDVTRRRLAGTLPFARDASVPFTPEHLIDLPDEVRPVAMLGRFSDEDRAKVIAWAKDNAGVSFSDLMVEVLASSGIRSWSNVRDLMTEEELPFTPENVALMRDSTFLYECYTRCAEFSGILRYEVPTKQEKEALG